MFLKIWKTKKLKNTIGVMLKDYHIFVINLSQRWIFYEELGICKVAA